LPQTAAQSRRSYRCYFIGTDCHTALARTVDATTDDEASQLAVLMMAEHSDYPRLELWDRMRRVRRIPPR
jgi:hypothetical protein